MSAVPREFLGLLQLRDGVRYGRTARLAVQYPRVHKLNILRALVAWKTAVNVKQEFEIPMLAQDCAYR